MHHLIVAPILLPLAAGAIMLLFDERQQRLKQSLSLITTTALLVVAILLFHDVAAAADAVHPKVYLLGNWASSVGIVLVVDHLSALMLLITSLLGLTSLIYSLARWDRSGPRFHALFLFLLMGINGAFLTGDIFNLFVFFEVLLAASYGLALHGAGIERTKASLHYIAFNIATSLLFLIGVALIYSVTGTLNMAALSDSVARLSKDDLVLLESGAAILGIAFLVKAGIWPLSFWLTRTYGAAIPPVAAVFPILTKVGIYVILRLSSLAFGDNAGQAAGFANNWLIYAGMMTIVFGTLAVLSAHQLTRVAGYYLLISSGTLLAAIGFGNTLVTAGALFYLISSTLGASAFYLLIEPVERTVKEEEASPMSEAVFDDEYIGTGSEDHETEIGVAIPATVALVGGAFIVCALVLSGMPPLPGFLAKFSIIHGLLQPEGGVDAAAWVMIALLIISGFSVLVTMTRAGVDLLWTPADRSRTQVASLEAIPVGILLAISFALLIGAGPVMNYMQRTAHTLSLPQNYIEAVRLAPRSGTDK